MGVGGEQTWGGAETLLGARVHAVHAPLICEEGNAAQAAHCIHQQQRAVLVAQLPQACQALVHPCAALPLQQHTWHLNLQTFSMGTVTIVSLRGHGLVQLGLGLKSDWA